MIADRQTLRDLEIFECRDGRQSVFDLLDRTRTLGGRSRLRERFRAPLSDPAAIAAVQDALRFVAARRDAFVRLDHACEPKRLVGLEAYLHSPNATSLATGEVALWLDGLWTRRRYRPVFDDAVAGVNLVPPWVDEVARLAEAVLAAGASPVVREVAEPLAALLSTPQLARLREAGGVSSGAPAAALRWDRVIRETLRHDLLRAVELLHELDALVSMADAVRELDLVFPVLDAPVLEAQAGLELQGVRHLFVPRPVPNDLRWNSGSRVFFLTGPNMAGKTTYLKACGVAVYLAHLGMGVPASAMRLAPLDRLFTGINTEDSVRLGLSYFFAEVRRVREIADGLAAGERAFVLFDEMFKWTNVKDACDATLRVVRAFARAGGSRFVVSSHLVELADELGATPAVQLGCFDAELHGDELRYEHRLKPGSSPQRLGLVLLEREGVFDVLDRLGEAAAPGDSADAAHPPSR